MFLVFPIRTDAPVRRPPYVNYGLIGLNILVFVLVDAFAGATGHSGIKSWMSLMSSRPQLYQFITYQFAHADIWHLVGNMVFLWVFGNAVNSKMGQLPYLLFYLSGGIFAGAAFALTNQNPIIGASGAIAAVTTAYLVLYPHSEVSLFYWLVFTIGTMHVQALLIIGLKIILYDNIISRAFASGSGQSSQIAYSAHLAGYTYGFVLGLLMLAIRAVPRDQYDILALWRRAYQRAQLRHAMTDPNAREQAIYGRVARPVSVAMGRPVQAVSPEVLDELTALRNEITDLLEKGDYTTASQKWESLIARHPDQCLPRRQMLDIANQLATLQRYGPAAAAYERYLKHYPKAPDVEHIALMLGIIYARNLQQYEPAARLLQQSLTRLTNPRERDAATQWLQAVTAALGHNPPPTPA